MTDKQLKIAITCFPTFGGSGVIATEIGMAMAARGHEVHFITYDIPHRLNRFLENIYYHEVEVSDYPLFVHPNYALALTSKMVEVSEKVGLDLIHVHYAIPHATSAYLAKQILEKRSPKVITTLHGTDITLVGHQRSYLSISRFSIMNSDVVTVPSRYLKAATYEKLNIPQSTPIEIIPNFVDTAQFAPRSNLQTKSIPRSLGLCSRSERLITHASNFRPVKRIQDVIKIFAEVNKTLPCHLALIGDGPERSAIEELVQSLGLAKQVCFLGRLESFVEILQNSDLFLLPSENESFGLAALEAMSCGVPVVATNSGGIPEVVADGETGYLCPVGDITELAHRACQILSNEELHLKLATAARNRTVKYFSKEKIALVYEQLYRSICN